MAKAITTTTDIDARTITFNFSNGAYVTATTLGLSAEIYTRLALHGLKQKLADAAAIPCDTVTGKSATIEDKHAAIVKVWDNLLEGNWGIIRDGSSEPKGGYLFNALVELYAGKKSAEDIKTFLAGKSKTEQAKLRENSKIKPIIDRMKAERLEASGIDTDALLSELDD